MSPSADVEYDVRLTADHEVELWEIAREGLLDSGGQNTFRRGFLYSANWKRTPKESDIAKAAEDLSLDLQKNLSNRVMPAKTLTAFPLSKAINNLQHDIPVDLAEMQRMGRFTLLRLILRADTLDGESLKYLGFRLGLPDTVRAITWAMWPTTKQTLVAAGGATVRVALNWSLGFEIPPLPVHPGSALGAGLKADINGNFLLVREWRRYRADIVATGQQDSFADWRLRKPRDVIGDVKFMWLVFSPNDVPELSVSLQGLYKIKPSLLRKTVSVGMKRSRPYKVIVPV
jgi:hypothetical protein